MDFSCTNPPSSGKMPDLRGALTPASGISAPKATTRDFDDNNENERKKSAREIDESHTSTNGSNGTTGASGTSATSGSSSSMFLDSFISFVFVFCFFLFETTRKENEINIKTIKTVEENHVQQSTRQRLLTNAMSKAGRIKTSLEKSLSKVTGMFFFFVWINEEKNKL